MVSVSKLATFSVATVYQCGSYLPVAVLLAASTAMETTILDCRIALFGMMSTSIGIPTSIVVPASKASLAT